jgi:hypothetical protein
MPALIAGLILMAGCGDGDASGATSGWPASAAGPACQLLEYEVVAAHLGIRFDTAGGGRKDKTITCALTQAGQEYPDLTLAVTTTGADEVIFKAVVAPSGSTAVKGLGRVAYRLEIAPKQKRGPGLELGWLSASGQLMVIRYTSAPAPAIEIDALAPKLLTLAKQVDQGPAAAA